jgi:asparagine synthase (glutamine-hydrolysing)
MCGITGFFNSRPDGYLTSNNLAIQVTAMADAITYRGPDDSGIWVDEKSALALGHRRLSILDLSPAGHQPMHSACGRYVIAFNGEIYNHLELRAQLAQQKISPIWRGHADTETLLACFVAWGIERTLQATVGMFALALWDRQQKVLTLARDRIGEKPLYYGWQQDVFLFGSELKALKAHPAFQKLIDRNSIALLFRHNYIPAPYSIYQGVHKLLPGHYLSIGLDTVAGNFIPESKAYWSFNDVVAAGLSHPFVGSENEAVDLLERQLKASIASQMLSDVPLGAFLSGGVDSSTVVSLMQAQSSQPVRTFTIGFHEEGYNEAVHAKAVADHLGTQHTELYVRSEDALAVIPKLPTMYCEPFSDSSQIPTYLVSQLARQHVTVSLSGDAGDELFGGYRRYTQALQFWNRMKKLPTPLRHTLASMLRALPSRFWIGAFASVSPLLPAHYRFANPADQVLKLAEVLMLSSGQDFYYQLVSHNKNPACLVIGAHEPLTKLTDIAAWPKTHSFEHWMMAMDTQTYLPDDILVKVDRAAMANSLETRVPFLDHRVVELAWRIPLNMKIRGDQGKWLLRQVLYRHVPKELIDRPKMGFGIPLGDWLRGPLREWAEELISESRLKREGYLHAAPIRQMWMEHLSGTCNWQYHLWDVLMFQAWLEKE